MDDLCKNTQLVFRYEISALLSSVNRTCVDLQETTLVLTGLGVGHNEGKGHQVGQEYNVDGEVGIVTVTAQCPPLVLEKAGDQGVFTKIELLTIHLNKTKIISLCTCMVKVNTPYNLHVYFCKYT